MELPNTTVPSHLDNTTCDHIHMKLGPEIVTGIALAMIDILTIGGNVLVLLAILINKKLRTVTNYLVASLATADLTLGVTVLPFSAILQLEKHWLFGRFFCNFWAAADVLCCTASIFSLCAISIDRYIGVTRPLQHRVSSIVAYLEPHYNALIAPLCRIACDPYMRGGCSLYFHCIPYSLHPL